MRLNCIIKKQVDYIIVGQGLAGSALALHLAWRGKRLMVFDLPQENRSSVIAAGMFNPFASKGITKTWMATEVFTHLHDFYPRAERLLGEKFFFQQLIYRPFVHIEEQNSWMAQTVDASISAFVEATHAKPAYGHQVHDPLGGIVAKQGGCIHTTVYLAAVRHWLSQNGAFRAEGFDVCQLDEGESFVKYQDLQANAVIFCTGVPLATEMKWLPVIKLKGETLNVAMQEAPQLIYNRGVYAVATPVGTYKVGSTYQLKNIIHDITLGGREELEMKMQQLLKISYTVLGQDWGIRPTTVDRKPVLGFWPGHTKRVIFNGLGTKGVSLAPYFAHVLATWLAGERELPPEVNINRFKALYSKI
ncbi:MAG: NAD(P)/FAD-dependent oxidoreductase [Flammeovirgaceae bacterium]